MTIVLHIGLPKTGSSALQDALARNRDRLRAHGVHYARARDEADGAAPAISSGNGVVLAKYLDPLRRGPKFSVERFESDFERLHLQPDMARSLISSELMASAKPDMLARFQDQLLGERALRVVAFVRDLYGHAAASWSQQIKRHGCAEDFDAFVAQYRNVQVNVVRAYARAVGRERMKLIHYDGEADNLATPLLKAVGAPAGLFTLPKNLNRGLTPNEADVLRACNRTHGDVGGLSRRLSDELLALRPNLPARPPYRPDLGEALQARFEADLGRFNRDLFGGRDGLSVGVPTPSGPAANQPDVRELWRDIAVTLESRLEALRKETRDEAERDAVERTLALADHQIRTR